MKQAKLMEAGGDMDLPDRGGMSAASDFDEMAENAKQATDFMKAMAHESRLMILCHLSSGEKSVTELEDLLALRQPTVSQQLARLRLERLITARRDGKTIFYSIADERALRMMDVVYDMFCKSKKPA